MKKIKLLSLLAAVAILTGCNSGGLSIKAPKFAKAKNEISVAEMKELLADKTLLGVFSEDTTANIPNCSFKAKESSLSTTKKTRGKLTPQYDVTKSIGEGKGGADVEKFMLETSSTTKVLNTTDRLVSKSSIGYTSKSDYTLLFGDVESVTYVLAADKLQKAYSGVYQAAGYTDAQKKAFVQDYAKSMVTSLVEDLSDALDLYDYLNDDQKANFHVYNDNKVLTVKYTAEQKDEATDSDSKLLYTVVTKGEMTYQLDARKGANFSFKSSVESTTTVTFAQTATYNFSTYYEGEVYEKRQCTYGENSVSTGKYSAKAVDLSSYAYVG